MLELLKCLAGSIYSKEYLLSKTLVQKPRAGFLARLLAQEIEVSFPAKDLYTGCAIHNDFPVNEFCDGIDVLAKYYELSKTQTCKRFSQIFRDGSACSVN